MSDSIREALSQAFAEKEEATPVQDSTPTPSPVVGNTEDTPVVAPVIGAAVEQKPVVSPAADKSPASPTGDKAAAATATTPVAATTPAPLAAPASWKNTEKAFWDKMPPEAKAAVQRRELETQRALSTSADARRHQQNFQQAMNPYEPLLQAYGVKNPIDALVPLMQTRAALEVGTPDQKAQLISNLVYQFGIDIQKLDGFLVRGPGQQAPAPQQQQAFDPHSIPELAPLFQIAEQYKNAQSTKVDAAIAEVETLPHFEDLREEMADILDMSTKRGRQVTVKEAYDHAARMAGLAPSPTAAVAPNVSEAAAIMARSRRAASSVAGAPKGGMGTKPTTLRETIEAAMAG